MSTESSTTWEEAAEAVASDIGLEYVMTYSVGPSTFVTSVDRETLEDVTSWTYVAREAARGYLTHNGADKFPVRHLLDTLAKKQADYGHDNILRYGIEGIKVRVSDKVCRLRNLLDGDKTPANESINDSFLDIVAYAVIALMLEAGTFELPLAADVVVGTDDDMVWTRWEEGIAVESGFHSVYPNVAAFIKAFDHVDVWHSDGTKSTYWFGQEGDF